MKTITRFPFLAVLAAGLASGMHAQPNAKGKARDESGASAAATSAKGSSATTKGSSGSTAGGVTAGATNPRGATPNAAVDSKGAGLRVEAKAVNENASDNAKAVHDVLDKFKSQREEYLSNRKVLLEKLKAASAAEKQAILEQMREQSKAREEEERALARQVREEIKKLREDRRGGG